MQAPWKPGKDRDCNVSQQKAVALGHELQVMWAVIRPDFFGPFSNNVVPIDSYFIRKRATV